MLKLFRSTILGAVFFATASGVASGAEKTFGPFSIDDANPSVITLDGAIDIGSALNFRRALQAAPQAKLVTLNSDGGNVQMGLLIADDIHQRKLATYISKEGGCYSACAYIFLAGTERKVDGKLGVHQISSDSPDLVGAQLTISDIIDVLNRFDTPMDVVSVMFKTPPDDMHVFTAEEIERYGLNRSGQEKVVEGSTPSEMGTAAIESAADEHQQAAAETTSNTRSSKPTSRVGASPLEEFTKRPNRIAVYAGLDLFGDDISSTRSEDAGQCAQACLSMNGQCKAFTFNANPKIKRGPNCFLKASAGRADGNSVAFSGRFLSGAEADPSSITLGTIDPNTALFDDVDLPGGDLSHHPDPLAKTPLDCRLACVDEKQCVAFTYIRVKKECWLKGAIGTPSSGRNMVSGVKKMESFSPAKIISLD